MPNAGYATLSVIPSARGFSKKLDAEVGPEVDKSGHNMGNRLASGLGGVLKKSMLLIGGAAGGVLAYSLTKGFKRLTNIENATAKLHGLGHSAKTVDKIMANALASVKGTAFGLDEAATTAAGAVASGVKPGKALERTLKLVADAATIGGTSMGEMGAIFNKVAASGKVQGDVIAQLGDKGIPVLQLLAKTIHKTPAETAKLASQGKIDFATFQKAMSSMSGAALKSGSTTTGAMKNLGASLSRIGAGLLGGVFPHLAPAISNLTKAMGPLEDKAAQLGDKIGKVLGPALENAVTNAQDFYAGLTLADPNSIGAPLEGYVAKGEKVRQFFTTVIPKAKAFFASLKGTGASASSVSSIGASFRQIGTSLSTIDWSKVTTAFGKSASDSVSVFSVVIGFLADHLDTLAQVLPLVATAYAAMKVAQAAANVVSVASLPTRALQSLSNYQLAAAMRANTAAMLANNGAQIESNAVGNVGILTRIRSAAATVAKTVAEKAAALASKAFAAAQWLVNAALDANPIGLVVIAIVALVAAIVLAWKNSETFRRIVLAAWGAIKAGIGVVVSWLGKAVPAVFSWIKQAFLKYTPLGVVISHWGQIRAFIGAAVAGIRATISWFGSLPGKFAGWFRGAYTAARGKLGDLVGIVRGLPGRILSALGDLGGLLVHAGAKLIQGLADGITSRIRAVTGAISGIASKIKGFFPGSPVREGPLVSWNNGAAGKRLAGLLVNGLDSGRGDVDAAMRRLVKAPAMPALDKAAIGAQRASTSEAGGPLRIRGQLDLGNGLTGFVDGVLEDAAGAAGRSF